MCIGVPIDPKRLAETESDESADSEESSMNGKRILRSAKLGELIIHKLMLYNLFNSQQLGAVVNLL